MQILTGNLINYWIKKMTKNNITWWEKFSPTIMEAEVPQKFIDIINNTGDEVLKDDTF